MSELLTLRINNIVDYQGTYGVTRDLTIISIDKTSEDIFIYQLKSAYGRNKFIDAQRTEIEGILLRDHHLLATGFKFDNKLKRYYINGISIGRFSWAIGTDRLTLTGVLTDFRVIPVGFPEEPSIDQINKGTIGGKYLHEFQNYCTDKQGWCRFLTNKSFSRCKGQPGIRIKILTG